jgi:alkanesulfonate monooxygenase SsuD/methylene tetrahydromethanopterin reductase-like flavin-dependent oxidoreductase (luciferase family)
MDVGIGLPATIPGTRGSFILDWAKRADSGSFSSLGILDRLVYPNYEPLITLAAAAAVTRRVRLMSTVLIGRCAGRACWRSRRPPSTRYREGASRWG